MLESKLTQFNWNSDKMIFWLLQLLGKALGIPENSVRTYTEAEIRAGYVALFKVVEILNSAEAFFPFFFPIFFMLYIS